MAWFLLLNSTDEQATQFLVCSLCEMLRNVKTEKFTLVFLRDHLIFAPCMATEGSQPEGDETCSPSSNSPGIVFEIFYPYFHRVVKMHQQLTLSPATLRFLQPVNYKKKAKKMDH